MKALLAVLATILTLSVSYYFALSLPAHNRAVLDFEREKYHTAQQEKKAKEEEEKNLRDSADQVLQWCSASADLAYSNNLKSNGTLNGHGGYSLPTANLTVIERQKTQAIEECHREYERTVRTSH